MTRWIDTRLPGRKSPTSLQKLKTRETWVKEEGQSMIDFVKDNTRVNAQSRPDRFDTKMPGKRASAQNLPTNFRNYPYSPQRQITPPGKMPLEWMPNSWFNSKPWREGPWRWRRPCKDAYLFRMCPMAFQSHVGVIFPPKQKIISRNPQPWMLRSIGISWLITLPNVVTLPASVYGVSWRPFKRARPTGIMSKNCWIYGRNFSSSDTGHTLTTYFM